MKKLNSFIGDGVCYRFPFTYRFSKIRITNILVSKNDRTLLIDDDYTMTIDGNLGEVWLKNPLPQGATLRIYAARPRFTEFYKDNDLLMAEAVEKYLEEYVLMKEYL